MACIALHFHWSYEVIMEMEHQERRDWVAEIAASLRGAEARPTRPFAAHQALR